MISDVEARLRKELSADLEHRPVNVPPLAAAQARAARRQRRARIGLTTAVAVAMLATSVLASHRSPSHDPQTSLAGPATTSVADALCQASTAAYGGTVAAAFPTTVGALRTYLGPSADNLLQAWQSKSATETAAVCYLDTTVSAPVPPGVPVPNRAQVFAVAGAPVVLSAAGQAATMPAVPIATGDRRPTP